MSTTTKKSRLSMEDSHGSAAADDRWTGKRFLAVAFLAAGFTMITVCSSSHAAGETPALYTLESIVQLALEHNPVMAGAQGMIDQQRGHQTASGACPLSELDRDGCSV